MIKKLVKYLLLKFKYSNRVKFDFSVDIDKNAFFEGMNKIHSNSQFSGKMGYGSYIGPNCVLNAQIGRYTSIGPNVRSNIGIHPYQVFVSTAPAFYSTSTVQNGRSYVEEDSFEELVFADKENRYGIVVGSDCWIGEGAFIVGGVTIGDGAVILAHSVVTRDVPSFTLVGGVPAKPIKKRFTEDQIEFLTKFKWWDKDEEWLIKNTKWMQNIDMFLKIHNK